LPRGLLGDRISRPQASAIVKTDGGKAGNLIVDEGLSVESTETLDQTLIREQKTN